ncbi:MAG: RsmF rRNA methyltransferase first C-terminal domain-containing protein [Anaerolineales bacterium]|nr:RsmF rRNA methyltransferase first C-terminal domain-containing protein [Anaerolineales bacterium]
MRHLLGADYAAFAASYEQAAHIGLRVNTLKMSAADFISKSPFTLTPVGEYEPAGFRVADETQPGRHPYHAAGLYYLQEPSAMAVAALLDPQPGEWVLDLAAAPGGKSTHLITRMKDQGLLVTNDVDRSRARDLAENLERWGARNTLITSSTPQQLAAHFGPLFDRVLVDAPCSGEGMFRKQGGFDWSENMVLACARRQTAILHTAVSLLRSGGILAYATCTFSPEEDEGVIGRFLAEHPDFSLITSPRFAGFAPGQPGWLPDDVQLPDTEQLAQATRFWPHRFAGEGHFVALLQKSGDNRLVQSGKLNQSPHPTRAEQQLWQAFARDALQVELDEERMVVSNGRYLHLLPPNAPDTTGLYVLRHGLPLAELRKNHLKPAHTLALALTADDVAHTANFAPDDPLLHAYLQGHPVPHNGPNGWLLITVDGFGLSWGKCVNGQIKNHYPRGLRR